MAKRPEAKWPKQNMVHMTTIHGEADIKPEIKGTLKPEHKWPKAKSQKPIGQSRTTYA